MARSWLYLMALMAGVGGIILNGQLGHSSGHLVALVVIVAVVVAGLTVESFR